MVTEVKMPQITMTMVEGVIAEWHKKKGEMVKEGEPLVDIETDKVVQTLNASASGVLQQVMAEPGDIVPVGQIFCVIGELSITTNLTNAEKVMPEIREESKQVMPVSDLHDRVVSMPQVTPQMKDAVIIRWLVQEGQQVESGSPLFDAEVDDVRRIVVAPESGMICRFLVHSGCTIHPGDALYEINGQQTTGTSLRGSREICATPMAKVLAARVGLNLMSVIPTGPGGLVVESDIKKAVIAPQTNPALSAVKPVSAMVVDDEIIPFIGIRKRIADNLMLTKQTMADVTTFAEVNMSRIKAFRENLHISFNAFILKAAALALGDYPIMNSSIVDDKIVIKKSIGLCVAVATKHGLVTPVMHHAEKMNLISIAEQLEDYAERGRNGTLTAEEFTGGTFTVTNSGTYGALFFTPIINFPQSAILGIGKIMMTPIVSDNGQIEAAPMMYTCLSYDHRVVDGETAVKFLQKVKLYLENPDQMTVIRRK